MISLHKQVEYQRKRVWYILLQLNFIHIYRLYKKCFGWENTSSKLKSFILGDPKNKPSYNESNVY
jgi:hypothetical protein